MSYQGMWNEGNEDKSEWQFGVYENCTIEKIELKTNKNDKQYFNFWAKSPTAGMEFIQVYLAASWKVLHFAKAVLGHMKYTKYKASNDWNGICGELENGGDYMGKTFAITKEEGEREGFAKYEITEEKSGEPTQAQEKDDSLEIPFGN